MTPHLPSRVLSGLAVAALLAWAPAARAQGPGRMPPASVAVAQAEEIAVSASIEVPGTVISRTDARIAAEISGRVVSIRDVGDMVEEGAAVAELDKRLLALEVAESEANVRRLEADLAFQTRNVARFRELAERNNAPARSVDEAAVAKDRAEQDLAVARIALERARINLERASVRAPFTGEVVERLVQQGEYVSTGTPVARLVDTTHVEVQARVPVRSAPYLTAGMTLDMTGFGQQAEGTLRTLVRVGNEVTRTFEIRLSLPDALWVIGTPVRVLVPTDNPRTVVAVPRDALVLRRTGAAVFKLGADNAARRIPVEPGSGSGTMIEVTGDIAPGDRVVIRGAERLRDGQVVDVVAEAVAAS
ncbi:MAG: efflux RND transporter periplasmic adaptor subunit [Alphaproteobacteria bacterium]